ncbi:Os09g0353500 [Oryza sativa Japonica Group]|uniref:Os09g0353500 protein n=1 Tax=Oryza sativa subsp. japonica TaxID=39947 RepID=C7J6V7_ORYSJ|nr:Os09g0353500 [Oryza sativa Japonica Group]|eukprot:NP_001175795.1 Os09g0353500 [Oryza sativa Japonica Group]
MELVTGGCFLRHLDELAKYVLIMLRADDGGKGSTFALYFLMYRHVCVGLLLPGAGAAGEELVVAGQCVDGAGVAAWAPQSAPPARSSWSRGSASMVRAWVSQPAPPVRSSWSRGSASTVRAWAPQRRCPCQPCVRAGVAQCPAEAAAAAAARDVHGQRMHTLFFESIESASIPISTVEYVKLFLGPISNLDPTEFINGETNRIPLRFANRDLSTWKGTFKSWPSAETSWPAWYKRMLVSKSTHWDEIGISQALALTATNMARDEPMMSAATYFWSTTMNAFLFSQGPMTPTLLDIVMITGLDITSSANLSSLNTQLTHEFKTRSIDGWGGYVAKNMGTGPVTPREHTAFLMMWLEKFLFCGPSYGPTANWQRVAENLVEKKHFPLGKYLLGYLYLTLNTAVDKMASGKTIGTGGPWWLLQTWLNLHTRKVANRPALADVEFPRFKPIIRDDGETSTTRRCMSFGEAASVSTVCKLSAEPFRERFNNFYDGFPRNDRVWFAYEGSASFELLDDFRFDEINSDMYEKSREVFTTAISPCIIPIGIHQGKNIKMTYEFYHPTSAARQFGMGQLPISLFFADKIQSRGEITSFLMMDRLQNLPGPPLGSIENIKLKTFRSAAFDRCRHPCISQTFFPDDVPQTTESSPPHQSISGVEIEYAPGLLPNGGGLTPPVIGYNASKTSTLLHGLPHVPIAPVAGRKRAKSTAAPSAVKKKPKNQKTTTDDLPAIDPDVADFLEDEALSEEVNEAAEHISETREQTPPADPPGPQITPSPPVRPTYQPRKNKIASKKPQGAAPLFPTDANLYSNLQPPRPSTPIFESSENTPSAVESHHVEEEEEVAAPAPTVPVLADMFSFDIRPFLDEEEETTSQALVPLADDIKTTLMDISKRLEGSLETLVTSCGSIRDRLNEIHPR